MNIVKHDNLNNCNKHKKLSQTVKNPRSYIVATRLNAGEYKRFIQRLHNNNLTITEALRSFIINDEIPKKIQGGINVNASDAYVKLQPLQNNLNQIAHYLNKADGKNLNPKNLRIVYDNVRACEELLKKLRSYILHKSTA